jgi:hypothetical protein
VTKLKRKYLFEIVSCAAWAISSACLSVNATEIGARVGWCVGSLGWAATLGMAVVMYMVAEEKS